MPAQPIERRYAPEKIAVIPLYNGKNTADIIRELAPTGEIVAHARKHGDHVHERMHNKGALSDDGFKAAEEFRSSFARAHMDGRFATIDLFKVRGCPTAHTSDATTAAHESVCMALRALSASRHAKGGLSVNQSAVWFLIGVGDSLEYFAWRMRSNGVSMTPDRASGMIGPLCDLLALHYGIIRVSDIKENAAKQVGEINYRRGIQAAADLAKILATSQWKTPAEFLAEFNRQLELKAAKRS